MVYDSSADRLILFGGQTFSQSGTVWFNDTWAYEYATNSWANRSPERAPRRGDPAGVAYDSRANRMIVLFGTSDVTVNGTHYVAYYNETWTYEYTTNTWTNRTSLPAPPTNSIIGMVYDSHADKTLAFGTGQFGTGQTWVYDYGLNMWAAISLGSGVPNLVGYSVAYDSAADRIILFGGWSTRQTWAYGVNANIWTNLTRGPQPGVLNAPMVYDSAAGQVILFGGEVPPYGWPFVANDTWAFSHANNTWTRLTLATRAPSGYRQAIAYDSARGRIFLIGGTLREGASNETWSLQYPLFGPNRPGPSQISLFWSIGLPAAVFVVVAFVGFWAWRRRGPRRRD